MLLFEEPVGARHAGMGLVADRMHKWDRGNDSGITNVTAAYVFCSLACPATRAVQDESQIPRLWFHWEWLCQSEILPCSRTGAVLLAEIEQLRHICWGSDNTISAMAEPKLLH